MANFTTIIPNETIQEYLAGTRSTITASIGTPSGCSLTLTNKSPIEYTISQNGQIIETVEPYTIVTLNTTHNMQVTADSTSSVAQALTLPSYRVSYTTSGLMVSATAKTSIQFPGALPVAGNMTVNNFPATIQVTTAAGDTVVVAGEVAITVPDGTHIGIDGVAVVEFNGTQEVSANITNATLDSNVINTVIGGNPGFLWSDNAAWTLDFPAPGDNANLNVFSANNQVVIVDKVYFSLASPSGHAGDYSVSIDPYWFGISPLFFGNVQSTLLPNNSGTISVFEIDFSELASSGLPINGLSLNITSAVALSETITYSIFARYASAEVVNTFENPANVLQPATAYNPVINGSITNGGTSQQMVGSNATRKFLRVWNTSATDILWFQFGQASGVDQGYPIGPGFGDTLEVPQPSNSVWVYGATAGDTYAYLEG